MATFTLARRHAQERARAARVKAKIAVEVGDVAPHRNVRATLPDDPARLRGLPVVGVKGGFGSAIRGTKPGV